MMSLSLLHPLLLALYLTISAYSEVRPLGNPWEALVLAPLMLILAWGVTAGLRRILKDTGKAALASSLLLFTVFLAGGIQTAFTNGSVFTLVFLSRDYKFLILVALLVTLLLRIIARTKRDLLSVNQAVLTGVAGLLLASAGSLLMDRRDAIWRAAVEPLPVRLESRERPPDIYYIVLDCYTSLDSLRDFWDYDSADFIAFLRKNHFLINPGAKSEFRRTLYCLSSRLNMRYQPPAFSSWENRYNRNALMRIIENSAGPALLESAGYKIVNLSMTPLGSEPAHYPMEFNLCIRSVFHSLADRSILRDLVATDTERTSAAGPRSLADARLRQFHTLDAVAAEPSEKPRFVFVHLMMTHAPFVFNRDGSLHDLLDEKTCTNTNYLDQLVYTTSLLTQSITRILENASQPPVIILQGDHGFRALKDDPENKVQESYSILSAMLLPGAPADDSQLDMLPVNTLRLVLNHVFKAGLPNLTSNVSARAIETSAGDND